MTQTDTLLIATHNGRFHEDDIFAVATLQLVLAKTGKKGTIIRTRDPHILDTAHFVVDVGGVYDPDTERFDHHQAGMAGERGGVYYASFGLVWKKYGMVLCEDRTVVDMVERALVMPIDALDNSQFFVRTSLPDVYPYTIHDFFDTLRPTWKEHLDWDMQFEKAVVYAMHILEREIIKHRDMLEAKRIAQNIYDQAPDKRLLVTDTLVPLSDLAEVFPDVLFVVFPNVADQTWVVHTLSTGESRANRKDLPAGWAGKRDGELEAVTGVSGAIFCHNKLFIAVAKTKEAAVELAHKALVA